MPRALKADNIIVKQQELNMIKETPKRIEEVFLSKSNHIPAVVEMMKTDDRSIMSDT